MSDTIYSLPGATFFSELDNAPTGLVGTVGVQIIRKSDGAVVLARTTAGIVESPTGSGRYVFTGIAPAEKAAFTVFWDIGSVSPSTTASDDLVVTANPPGPPEPIPSAISGRSYAYASLQDVQSFLPGVNFMATSAKPGATQVANFLNLASDDLDSLLGTLDYSVPIATTATQAMEMLRNWTTIGAAYRTAIAMPQGKESKHAETYGKEWTAILKSIESGQRFLPDASRAVGRLPRSASADPCPPVFTRAGSQNLR